MRKNAQETFDILEKLIAFDTVSRNSNLDLIHYIRDYLAALGIESELFHDENGEKANLFATIGGPADVPGMVLSGHTDVVPVEDQDWITDPFILSEADGKLFGRGTADMKSFIAICLALAPQIKAADLAQPIHFAFSYDEEIGCRGVPSLVNSLARRTPRPRLCIVGEPTELRAVTAHKGIRALETWITGRESHSSNTEFGVSATMAATRLAGFLSDILEEMKDRADPHSRFDPPYTSLNIGILEGGTAVNIIPNHCRMVWEYRTLPEADDTEILDRFTEFAEIEVLPDMKARFPEAHITTRQLAHAPPFVAEDNSEAEELVLRLTGQNETLTAPYVTEAGLFQSAGMSTVVCGPGNIDQAHRPNEFIEISQIEAGIEFVEKLIGAASR